MITVGIDFGTHQTKICYETIESGTVFYNVFRFEKPDGAEALTLPSFVRIGDNGMVRYGHDAIEDDAGGRAFTYFKQVMYSWQSTKAARIEAERLSALYLTFVILKLDSRFRTDKYIVHMGMPTDADPQHYAFCKRQAIKVMATAMLLARNLFRGDNERFLNTSYQELTALVERCMAVVPSDIHEARKRWPIFVFPEAYVALIPLIDDNKLPRIGVNLFVDIGGGTVDISLFTNEMDISYGRDCPCLYYYHSIPFGLNRITEQNLRSSHVVEVERRMFTGYRVDLFRSELIFAIQDIMKILKERYVELGKTSAMPFANLCAMTLHDRPICYSGGGSMFRELRLPIDNSKDGVSFDFSQVTTVSELMDHSKLYVNDKMFHVLATAFALSHRSLINLTKARQGEEPDSINLVSVEKLFRGVRVPQISSANPKRWSW